MLFFQLMKHEMLPVEGAPQAKQYTVYTKQQMGYNSHTRAQAHAPFCQSVPLYISLKHLLEQHVTQLFNFSV